MPWKQELVNVLITHPPASTTIGYNLQQILENDVQNQKRTFLSPELGRFRPSRLEEDSVTVRRPSRYTWQHWGIQGARNVGSWWWNTRTNPHEMPVTMVKQWLVKTISTVEIFTSQVQHETMEKSKFWKIRAIFRGVSKIWSLMHCQFPCDMGRCQVMLLHTRNMMRKVSWLVD